MAPAPPGRGALDQKPTGWKRAELQSWVGHGYHHRPHQTRNSTGPAASWTHSLTSAPSIS
eukprot:4423960-Pyramimonas_sp.AAC.1